MAMLKTAIVTGASSGLGLHTAKKLFATGRYKLVLACRNESKTKSAIEEIRKSCPDQDGNLLNYILLDLSNRLSVASFVDEFRTRFDGLDLLVNNAGIMNHPAALASDGIEVHFSTNHIGHYQLTKLLLSMMRPEARIVVVTSGFYKKATSILPLEQLTSLEKVRTYKPNYLYAVSKLANCLHTLYLHNLCQSSEEECLKSLQVFVVRPGFVKGTELGRHTHWTLRTLAAPLIWAIAKDLDSGTSTILHCATADKESLTSGRLYADCKEESFEPCVTLEAAQELVQLSDRLIEGKDIVTEIAASGDH